MLWQITFPAFGTILTCTITSDVEDAKRENRLILAMAGSLTVVIPGFTE